MDLSSTITSTLSILPEIVLVLTSILIILVGPVLKSHSKIYTFIISLVGISIAFILNFNRFDNPTISFAGALSLDNFAAFFNSIFLFGGFITVMLSKDYMSQNKNTVEYYSLILISIMGMMFLSSAKEFMSLFIGFEIMSIAVYILSGFNRTSPISTESGIKYLVLGGFSSAILLFGIAFLYGATGSIYLNEIFSNVDFQNPLYLTGSLLVIIGFLFKIGAAPLHQWIPDIYEGAPTPITAFMSVAVKAAGFAILLRVLFEGIGAQELGLENIIFWVSILTMTVGNVVAITQKSIKRMLAYSSIAHAGYALIGILARISGEETAISGVLYYLYAYTIMNLGAFGILCYLSRENKDFNDFEHISGLWKSKPIMALSLAVFMFSLAGIPPTIGFFAKYRVFLSSIEAGQYLIAIIGIINSVISAYYYLKVLVYAFMKEEKFSFVSIKPLSIAIILILVIGTLFLGIFPLYSIDLANKAAESITAASLL